MKLSECFRHNNRAPRDAVRFLVGYKRRKLNMCQECYESFVAWYSAPVIVTYLDADNVVEDTPLFNLEDI